MKFTQEQKTELGALAKSINVELAALLAVIAVESNGSPGEIINGRLEPLIRYEGHYFDKLCDPAVRPLARKLGVSSPTAGGVKNPSSQVNRWSLVKRAAGLDKVAAYSSCSYGVGQVMGSHWKKLGYASVDALVADSRNGVVGQAKIMVKFIKEFGLDDELRNLDWSGFARGYNGPAYAKNKYDTKMASAYATYGGAGTIPANRSGYLRLGSTGAGVRDLQGLLNIAGFKINVDGDFGTATRDAVKAYQAYNGLLPDGVVGPLTQTALTTVRATAPDNVGQQKVLDIAGVKEGLGTGIAVPAVINGVKEQLEAVAVQITPYAYLGKVLEYVQTGIAVVTVVGLVAGVGFAGYRWYQSRKSYTGTTAIVE